MCKNPRNGINCVIAVILINNPGILIRNRAINSACDVLFLNFSIDVKENKKPLDANNVSLLYHPKMEVRGGDNLDGGREPLGECSRVASPALPKFGAEGEGKSLIFLKGVSLERSAVCL